MLLEDNQISEAVRHARIGIDLAEQWGWADARVFGYAYLASALQAAGNSDGAFEAARRARTIASPLSDWLEAQMDALEVRLQLAQGNLTQAQKWAERTALKVEDPVAFEEMDRYLTLVRV